jgi:hypothetical protein
VLISVDLDEPLPSLIVMRKRLIRAPRHAQHGREIHQHGVEENIGNTGFPAEIVGLKGQFLGTGDIPYRAPVVDQVGGGPERVHVVHAQVVAAALEYMLAFL